MAFIPRNLSGFAAGSGKAPGISTYVTNDLPVDLTTDNYFKPMGGGMEYNDIIFAITEVDSTPTEATLICTYALGGSAWDVKYVLMSGYVGDVRGDDAVGYQSDNFSGNIGAGSDQRLFTYRNNSNTMAEITASGYFNDLAVVLAPGDLIIAVSNDAASYVRVLDVVDRVVTTEAIDITVTGDATTDIKWNVISKLVIKTVN